MKIRWIPEFDYTPAGTTSRNRRLRLPKKRNDAENKVENAVQGKTDGDAGSL
jgi:hypothetical protein